MEGYIVNIRESSRELTARERIKMKDTSNDVQLDEATKGAPLVITPDMYVILDIHNEKSDNKDYIKFIIVDKAGTKYITGSESLFTSFMEIHSEMAETGEEYDIEIYRMPSKNYKGKEFLTCSIV